MKAPSLIGLCVGLFASSCSLLQAQCETAWQTAISTFTMGGRVSALAEWDPDGAGPQPMQVVAGGQFTSGGAVALDNLGVLDPIARTWSSIGGTNGHVQAIAVMPNGDLVIGGAFSSVGGVPVGNLARWDGASWSNVGTVSGSVLALEATAAGRLLVGGVFSAVDGVAAVNVAMLDQGTWSAMGAGLPGGQGVPPGVVDLAELDGGEIAAVGSFSTAGSGSNGIAVWDGNSWTAIGPGGLVLQWSAALALPGGDLLVGGAATSGAVQRWNGTSWAALPTIAGFVRDLALLPNGNFVAVTKTGQPDAVQLYDGTGWTLLNALSPFSEPEVLLPVTVAGSDQWLLGGEIEALTSAQGSGLFFYDGTAFSTETAFVGGSVVDLHAFPDGELYAVGEFSEIEGQPVANIARWDNGWQSVGALPWRSLGIGQLLDGTPVATTTGGVYQFDGANWQLINGSPTNNSFRKAPVSARPNGDLLVGGDRIRRFDGATWSNIPNTLQVTDLLPLPNGDLVAAGKLSISFPVPGRIAIWDGSSGWTALDPTVQFASIPEVAVLPNGDIVAVADSVVRRFDGSMWTELGSLDGPVTSVEVAIDGKLYVGGNFTANAGVPCRNLARWNGSAWVPVAGGSPLTVQKMAARANGDTFAITQYPFPNQAFVRHETACPAAAVSVAPGCPSAGGSNALVALRLALAGATYTARATGLPANALVFDLYGTQPVSVPLPSLFALGQPGCTLAVAPILARLESAPGELVSELALPAQPSLAGITLRHQMLVFEVNAVSALVAATVTNALDVTIGSAF